MRILVVEDEPDMGTLIARALRRDGLAVDVVRTIRLAREAVCLSRYSVVVLDRRLPDGDGVDLLPDIRALRPTTAVIVLSALDGPSDVIVGLDAGAGDYLGKPFDLGELRARVRVALRSANDVSEPALNSGNVTLDLMTRSITVATRPLVLKRREVSLIESLLRRAGRVVSREALIEEMYGFDDEIQSNTLDAHVSRLRSRLREAGATTTIHTLRGLGYMLSETSAWS